jgi:1-acyl-sn-glycerol-3-phosphate acyltransferase
MTVSTRSFPPPLAGARWLHRLAVWGAIVLFWPWTAVMTVGVRLGALVSPRWAHVPHRWWGVVTCRLFGIVVTFEGLEHLAPFRDAAKRGAPGAILAPNHESLFDIFVLASMPFDFAWIAKVEVRRIPIIGTALRGLGCFFLRRDGSSRDILTLKAVEDGLRRGQSVVIFPEGTRTRTGQLLPFKKGAFRTALEAGAPIVPIRLRGTFTIAPAGTVPNRIGHHVHVHVGAPIVPKPDDTVDGLLERYRAALLAL